MGIFSKLFGSYSTRELARIEPIKQKVLALDEEYTALSDAELKGKTQEFRDRLESGEALDSMMAEALATVREAAYRVLGKKPFPVQIIGAIVLHQGRIAEMKTGEGKTLVACVGRGLGCVQLRAQAAGAAARTRGLPDAVHEQRRVDRLLHEVHRAEIGTLHEYLVIVDRGCNDHARRLLLGLQPRQQRHTVDACQHKV